MARPAHYLGQIIAYSLFAVVVGYFSVAPAYSPTPEDSAVVTLSFAHAGKRVTECRERSPEELGKLPPNMRSPMDCSRERSPVKVRFMVDGEVHFERTLRPTGFSRDGTSYVYTKSFLPAGYHILELYLNDNSHQADGAYEHRAEIDLKPYQILVIDFNPDTGFSLH